MLAYELRFWFFFKFQFKIFTFSTDTNERWQFRSIENDIHEQDEKTHSSTIWQKYNDKINIFQANYVAIFYVIFYLRFLKQVSEERCLTEGLI